MIDFISKGVKGFQKGHSVPKKIRDKIRKRALGQMRSGIRKGVFKKGHKTNLGKKFPKEKYLNAGMRNKKHSEKTKEKIRIGNLDKHTGEKNPFWKGGISSLRARIYVCSEYKKWRESVFRRDNYTCQDCGKVGNKLNAHHIKPFSLFPKLRLVVCNGRTLCIKCHKITPTYGNFLFTNKKYMAVC